MSEPEQSLCRKFSRVEQNLRNLLRRTEEIRALTGQVAGSSEETAQLFSGGTRPAVKVIHETPSLKALKAAEMIVR